MKNNSIKEKKINLIEKLKVWLYFKRMGWKIVWKEIKIP
jgi:hypothetical protein